MPSGCVMKLDRRGYVDCKGFRVTGFRVKALGFARNIRPIPYNPKAVKLKTLNPHTLKPVAAQPEPCKHVIQRMEPRQKLPPYHIRFRVRV